MSVRLRLSLAVLALGWLLPGAARAAKLEKEDKAWLEQVSPLILPEEERRFRDLKHKGDREEFKKIFWARRDPNLETPDNEFQAEYTRTVAEANRRYAVGGKAGVATDCGRVFVLLGEPNEVKKVSGSENRGPRVPETWLFRDRPGITFAGGQVELTFDAECKFTGSGLAEQLKRLAETKIAYPNIDYRTGSDGKLVKLADLLPKPTPAQALLKAPRQDFAVEVQANYLKTQDGGTSVVGLTRGDASGLDVQDAGGRKTVKVVLCARAVEEGGRVAATTEQEATAEVGADGHFVASFRIGLKAGKYTLTAGALDPKTQKGSVSAVPIEVPSLNKEELTVASIAIVQTVEENVTAADPSHPFAAYHLGTMRLIPRFGSTLAQSETPSFFYQFYDAKADEAGKRSAVASFVILKDGKQPVARAEDRAFDGPVGGDLIGPVPLKNYAPGRYVARLTVKDNVAGKEYVRELPFEIK